MYLQPAQKRAFQHKISDGTVAVHSGINFICYIFSITASTYVHYQVLRLTSAFRGKYTIAAEKYSAGAISSNHQRVLLSVSRVDISSHE